VSPSVAVQLVRVLNICTIILYHKLLYQQVLNICAGVRPGAAVRVAPGNEDFDGLERFMGLVGYLRRRDKHGWYAYLVNI